MECRNDSYLRTGLDIAKGVAIPSAFIRCCMVGVAEEDKFPTPTILCCGFCCCNCCCCCWFCCTLISGGGWSGERPSGVYALEGSIPLWKRRQQLKGNPFSDHLKHAIYLCRGCGLYLGCWYIRMCLGESPLFWPIAFIPSMGGRKKLLFEPCRCNGGVGSQSWLCDACGSISISEHSRPGDSWFFWWK